MGDWLLHQVRRRPWWMNGLLLFCGWMAFVYIPFWDLPKPMARDEEVWFGLQAHGALAKLLMVPHWLIYAAGTLGFWRMRAWMWPWAAVYAAQVAFSMAVWPLASGQRASPVAFGLAAAVVWTFVARALLRARNRFGRARESLRARYGDWALVTGASSGIGAEFARALAREGVSLVLAARRGEQLETLARELTEGWRIQTRCVPCDLAGEAGVRTLLTAIADLEIAILVNNAGVGYVGRFHEQDPQRLAAMVQLNCATPVALAAALLPKMVARGRGALIFTGSVSGSQPLPLHALYSATKVFDNFLGEALWGELQGTGVDVLSLLPGSTDTEFARAADELAHAGADPARVVRDAFEALGEQPSVISGWFNWTRANAGMRLAPRSLLTLVAKGVIAKWVPGKPSIPARREL
jgi:short-subunit dehydrogenase